MALIKCRECGKKVSTQAVSCPHCGAKQVVETENEVKSKPAKARWSAIGIGLVGFLFLFGIMSSLIGKRGSTSPVVTAAAVSSSAKCNIRKANGGEPDRPCDLVELCKDRDYRRKKIAQYSGEGEFKKVVQATTDLNQILGWLDVYRPEDVSWVCNGIPMPTSPPATATSTPIFGCTLSPLDIFPMGKSMRLLDLSAEASQKCPGAVVNADKSISVRWQDREYLVGTARSVGPDGLEQYVISSIRAK